ncbi:MAG: bifunctional pyr operon transcriptional regulator/uracil phosphoribosyltransferase PyrR [Gammaproteobacteria bacterium]|nr:bifunctional pyr operon transcriptional regulator/uracil phosphoribosyltransferase PyrR [Gammaproteobacteria bacterium]MDH5802112.1 bifunctional pyr operon transcriptional regulator/uracil phosphoribosyltransferase PyrR [Gammaproteobacteria bacterium]
MREPNEVENLLGQMAQQVKERLLSIGNGAAGDDILMIGIHSGGVWIAKRLHQLLGLSQPLGNLDISFYRDDFSRIGMNPQVKPSQLPVSVDAKHILLVDDILHTGRTIRAAMNEIFDYGRPASITLIVLGERTGRELPIQPDIVGKHLNLTSGQHVKLSGPDTLTLTVMESS